MPAALWLLLALAQEEAMLQLWLLWPLPMQPRLLLLLLQLLLQSKLPALAPRPPLPLQRRLSCPALSSWTLGGMACCC